MMAYLRELIKYREVLYMITWRDIRVKYKQSVMGFMWALFMPMLIVLTGILVKLAIAKISGGEVTLSQVVGVAVKALPWSFCVSSIRFSVRSLTGNYSLVTKVYLPKEVFPISAVASQFVDFLIASSCLVIILLIAQIGYSIYLLWVPFLLVVLMFFTIGMGLLLSAANLFFRDVMYIVEVVLTFAIFFTPVFYDVDIAGNLQWVLLLNPVAPILEGLNACVVLHQSPKVEWVVYSAVVAVFGLLAAFSLFKKLEPGFAENI